MFRAITSITNTASQFVPDLSTISSSVSDCFNYCMGLDDDTLIPMHAVGLIKGKRMTMENLEDLFETFPTEMASTMKIGRSSKTLLHLAAERGEIEAIKTILKGRFININALGVLHSHEHDETLSRMTPLMFAVYKNQLEAAALLIERGADLDAKNSKGETALMILQCSKVNSTVLSLLEEHALQKCSDTDPLTKHSAYAAVESKHSENLTNRYC